MRAIELSHQGVTQSKPKARPFQILKIGLELPRELLYQRINSRVDAMMRDGLLEEVKSLVQYEKLNALKTVGYKELFSYLHGEIELNKSVELIKQHTRNYAKRQITWFKTDADINWFSPENQFDILEFIQNF
jgi:tRNA dimethylallyltransferase